MEENKSVNKFELEFGLMLREKRCMAGWTQANLAKKLGVGSSYVSMLEHGRTRAPLDIIGKLARMLRMDRRTVLLMISNDLADKAEIEFNVGYEAVKPYTNFGKNLHP